MRKYVIYQGNNSQLLVPALERRGNWREAEDSEKNKVQFLWKPTQFPEWAYSQKDRKLSQAVHNHLDNISLITTKTGLIASLRQFYHSYEPAIYAGYSAYDSIPTSFIMRGNTNDLEYRLFLNRFNEIALRKAFKERMPEKHCRQNMWLVKPADLNQGRGIQVCKKLNSVLTFLRSKPSNSLWLVQKYIERPLLLNKRKFDIRVWAMATANNDLFYYSKGYLRTSSSVYDTDATDVYVHLTNNCLQQHSSDYGAFEAGNTLSYEDFQKYLDEVFPEIKLDFWRDFVPRIKDLMIDVFLSSKKHLQRVSRPLCFELLGFDFLIDADFRVWLIEVNTNPYLGIPNNYIKGILPNMIEDMLKLTLDLHYPPKNLPESSENLFELIYCENSSKYSRVPVNQRQGYEVTLYPFGNSPERMYREETSVSPPVKVHATSALPEVKEMIESLFLYEVNDYKPVASKVISQITTWELLGEDIRRDCVEALAMLMNSPGAAVFADDQFCNILVSFIVSESHSVEAISAITKGMHSYKFKKQMVKSGICHVLIALTFTRTEAVKEVSYKALLVLASHPCKKIWIPGETSEQNWIRKKLLHEGVFFALISHSPVPHRFLERELSIPEIEGQIKIINSLSARNQTVKHKFPKTLASSSLITNAQTVLEELFLKKKEEAEARNREEIERREIEIKERQREEAEREKAEEEKKKKLQDYLRKKNEEIRNKRLLEKKEVSCKELDETTVKDRKQAYSCLFKRKNDLEKLYKRTQFSQVDNLAISNSMYRSRTLLKKLPKISMKGEYHKSKILLSRSMSKKETGKMYE